MSLLGHVWTAPACRASGMPIAWVILSLSSLSRPRPPVVSRRHADMLPEATCAVALIGKSGGDGNFRERHVGARQQLHRSFDPPPYQIIMWRHSNRLLERPHEVVDREIRDLRQGFEADPLVDVAVDMLTHPSHHARWQPAAYLHGRLG